jgi:hypothetical protein
MSSGFPIQVLFLRAMERGGIHPRILDFHTMCKKTIFTLRLFYTEIKEDDILGSHGGDYTHYSLLGSDSAWYGGYLPTFPRTVLLPSSK